MAASSYDTSELEDLVHIIDHRLDHVFVSYALDEERRVL
jgi:hypothetical protein